MSKIQDRLQALFLQEGAAQTAVIPEAKIVTSGKYRELCEANQCGKYGQCWMCPPDVGPIEDLMDMIHQYPVSVWFQTTYHLEDNFDIKGMMAGSKAHSAMAHRIKKKLPEILGKAPYLLLSVGGCGVCERCSKRDGLPCRHPDEAVTSLEACGISVYDSIQGTDMLYINGEGTVTFFGAVFLKEN